MWAPSGVLRDVLSDVPRPILSRDEPPFVPAEERPVPRNMNISQDILRKFGYTPGCAKCRNCRATNTPIQAWHILRIVAPGSRQQAGQTLCIVTVLSVQNNEDGLLLKRRRHLIIQEEPHWNRVTYLDHQLERQKFHAVTQKVKIIQVLGMSSGPWGARAGFFRRNPFSKCRRHADHSRDPCVAIRCVEPHQAVVWSVPTVKLPRCEFSWRLVRQWSETCTRRQYCE